MLLPRSFQSTRVLEKGLSDFHLMTLAVMAFLKSHICYIYLTGIYKFLAIFNNTESRNSNVRPAHRILKGMDDN